MSSWLILLIFSHFFNYLHAKCPVGTIEGHDSNSCYKFYGSISNFYDAEAKCEANGGYLTSVPNGFTNAFLGETFRDIIQDPQAKIFLGGIKKGSIWTWTDGSPFSYTNWANGQPDPKGSCLVMDPTTSSWSATACQSTFSYMCEISAISGPTQSPSCSVVPMCDSEWTYLNYTNSCYKAYSNEWKNWTTAQYICRENQANLTSIHSWDENLFLIDLTTTGMTMPPSSQVYHVWIGLYSPNKDMKFQWIDGTNFDAQFWGQSQPWNNPIGDSTVLCADHTPDFDYDYQKWFTDPGSQNERAFVCKKPAKLSC